MSLITFYLDGKYIKVPRASIESFTPGVFKATGVFETLRADRGAIYFLDEHVMRMKKGLRQLTIKNPLVVNKWHAIIVKLLKIDQYQHARIRLMVWQEGKTVHHAVIVLPYKLLTRQQQEQGLKVCLIQTDRPASRTYADVKSLDYQLFADSYQQAVKQGYDDALLINRKGYIFESTRANIFVLIKDQLITPPLSSGCLNGITRMQMMAMGSSIQIPTKEQQITPQMLKKAKAIYLTNSLMGLIPVNLTTAAL